MRWPILTAWLLVEAVAAAQRSQAPAPLVKENATVKVSDHVYVIPDDSVPLVPNVGIVVGSAATLVVDTGLGPRNGQAVLREVAKISRNARLYLVTTHYHPEHVAGMSAFPSGTTYVISSEQQKELDESGRQMIERFAGFSPTASELLRDAPLRRADVVFEREHSFDLGGVPIRLLALGRTHTRGDTMVFVPNDRVLLAGDVVMNRAFLAFGDQSSARTWLDVLDRLAPLQATTIVPSHGPIGGGSLVNEQRDVLRAIEARVRELKAQGRSADDAARALTDDFRMRYPDWTGPNRVGAAVRSFYAES
jgi:glyoxylase-like metal-dependent hydrolase (beta-lactamase superfamily II)